MGRQGRIWNCVRIFSAAGFAAAMRRRCTCRGRSKPQCVENSGVLEFSFPLCKSGPAPGGRDLERCGLQELLKRRAALGQCGGGAARYAGGAA